MIAALPMYDRPETAAVNDRFWQEIRATLGFGPSTLSRPSDLWEVWQSPDLLLAQTCGLPYRAWLHGHVTLVATPDYDLPDCPPGYYNSLFITRLGDTDALADYENRLFAYNGPLSQSGWAAAVTHMAELGLRLESGRETGSHHASARAVAEGKADFATMDAHTWRLMQRHDDFAAQLQVIAGTLPTPALPFITAKGNSASTIRAALKTALTRLSPADREALGCRQFLSIPAQSYLAVPTPKPPVSSEK